MSQTEKPLKARKRTMIRRIAFTEAGAAALAQLFEIGRRYGFPVIHEGFRLRQLCNARTRRGTLCRGYALTNGRCKLHGGLSTGPKTAAGWKRTRAGYNAWRRAQRQKKGLQA